MNRRTRTVVVVGIAVTMASLASFGVYRAIQGIPVREVPIATVHTVVARQALPVGIHVTARDLKVVPWPESNPVPDGFTDIDDVVGRGVVASVVENEPLTERKLAPLGPASNDADTIARLIQAGVNVFRLNMSHGEHAGHRDTFRCVRRLAEEANRHFAILADLAGPNFRVGRFVAGSIVLALRNPLDVQPTETAGIRMASLMGAPDPPPVRRTVRNRQVVVTPPPPQPYTVEAIRAAKRTQETIQ